MPIKVGLASADTDPKGGQTDRGAAMGVYNRLRVPVLAGTLVVCLVAATVGILFALGRSSQSGAAMREEAEEALLVLEMERSIEAIAGHTAGLVAPIADHSGEDTSSGERDTAEPGDPLDVTGAAGDHPDLDDHPEVTAALDSFRTAAVELIPMLPSANRPLVGTLLDTLRDYELSIEELHAAEGEGENTMATYHATTLVHETRLRTLLTDLQSEEAVEIKEAIVSSIAAERERWLWWLVPALSLLGMLIAGYLMWLHAERHRHDVKTLQRINRDKDRFITSVSHELRTPLTSVLGFIELLEGDGDAFDDRQRRELLGLAAREAQDLTHLIEDLLVIGRSDNGTVFVADVEVDLRAQVEQVLEAIDTPPAVDLEVDGRDVKGRGDPARVRQIVRNLLSNAFRYGGGNVRVVVRPGAAAASVRVIDDGPGIPEPERERIFEAYQRAHSPATQPASVGLGLAVSRRLARAMGGDLIYSYRDSASVFELTLPLPSPTPATEELRRSVV